MKELRYNKCMKVSSYHLNIDYYQSSDHQLNPSCTNCSENATAGLGQLNDKTKEVRSNHKSITDLSANERQQLSQLQQRDSEVRAHEAAHIAAGGSVVNGGASFTYQEGPDGKLYAIGGEVPISISSGSTPNESIAIARQVQAAALAPASPSPQDLKVAASAAMMEARARQELSIMRSEVRQLEQATQSYSSAQEKAELRSQFDLYT